MTNTKTWKLGFNTMCDLNEEKAERHLQIIAESGFDYVYLEWHYWDDGWDKPLPPEPGFKLVEHFKKQLTPHSLHVPTLFKNWEIDIKYSLDCLKKIIEVGERFKVRFLTLHPFPDFSISIFSEQYVQEYEKKLCEVLFRACEIASKSLSFTLENLIPVSGSRYFCDAFELLKIIKKVNISNLGICLDTGHANIAGLDPAQMIREFDSCLFETHFNDNLGYFDKKIKEIDCDLHRPPGIGLINWIEVIKALNEINFPGPVNFELGMRKGDNFQNLAETTYRNWCEFEKY